MSIKIDQNKCIGCENCSRVCPEGIDMINGKAVIKNVDAKCLQKASRVCPINIIEFTKDEDEEQGLKKGKKFGDLIEFFVPEIDMEKMKLTIEILGDSEDK